MGGCTLLVLRSCWLLGQDSVMVLNTIVLNKFLHYFERCRLEDQEGDVKIERTVSPHKIHCFSSRISCLQSLSVKNAASLSLASVHFV